METFYTNSEEIKDIIKGFTLTKTLFVSSILIGEAYTGKKTLIYSIFPNTPIVSGKNEQEVKDALSLYDELIIFDFNLLSNQDMLDFNNKRIIAVANSMGNSSIVDKLFAFIYIMPPLKDRYEDVIYLKNLFIKEGREILMVEDNININSKNIDIDLSKNSQSLKRSIFLHIIKETMQKEEIEDLLFEYFFKNLKGKDGYRENLSIYEIPLLKAGLKKFGSQLQLSQILGINRNTLRKKINEHKID